MEVVTGALPSLLPKLSNLVAGEYNLQKGLKGEIKFLQEELESMKGALEDISKTPTDQLPNKDKIWARNVRELSYDTEDSVDKFMVQCKGKRLSKQQGLKKVIGRSLDLLMQPKIRRKIATEIREIKSRVIEVHERHRRYEVSLGVESVDKPVTVDPRLFAQYSEMKELVGIEEARDELISKIMIEENEAPMKQGIIVSIVGFGGLGKTTLANAVYEKIRARFDCCAFVSVTQTADLKKLYKGLLYDLSKSMDEEILDEEILDERRLINMLREFLEKKRYFVVIDDIWAISVWKMIRCALPDNDAGYTIVTTTRISNVAEQAGGAYKMQPLSLNNSRKLLYRRVFGNQKKEKDEDIEKYLGEELAEVSHKILKKCAGVPLAIIAMASLLACKARNKLEWYEVYNSVGTGLENNLDVENMRKILSFSYYELPCHLRTCLLYLIMFPEDYEIDKDRLIMMWIGEGFIQCENSGKSLYELGESYFNELINRSMIQPIYNSFHDTISSCLVHDMVLDLIRSLSGEENFATALSDMGSTYLSNTIRRLSLQNCKESHQMGQVTRSLQHARSVVAFPAAVSLLPALGCCRVLRVLNLQDCNLQAISSLKYLGNLHHLRYLGLRRTHISQLPEEMGNLQFLQILDVRATEISCLPWSIVQLRKLMCLYVDESTRVPNGIGNLTYLEQLSSLGIDDSTTNIIEELSELTELRQLSIQLDEWSDKLLECLCKLQKMQELVIRVDPGQRSIDGLDAWVAPQHLRLLFTQRSCWFSTLPAWLNPSHLPKLTQLSISVRELHQVDLEILGRLPALRFLSLEVDNKNLGILQGFIVGARAFPCLVSCHFWQFVWPVIFVQGAMQRLRKLRFFSFYLREASGIASASNDGCLNLGLGNLPSLQHVEAELRCDGAGKEEVEQAKATLTRAAEMHPNHPRHRIFT